MRAIRRLAGRALGVSAIVVDAEGRILLVRHSYTQGWFLPGGGVERGESAEAALAREIREECGIALLAPATAFGVYRMRKGGPRDRVAVFVVCDFEQKTKPKPNWEIVDSGFFSRDKLPPDISKGARRRLAELFDGAERDEFW